VRHLVMGDERNTAQQAEKLQGKTTGVPLNSPTGFVPQTHPLLQCLHDIPTFLEALRRHFDALKALGVATEYKMRPHRFLQVVMRFVAPHLKDVHDRYLREIQSFTFEDLETLVRTYDENQGYLDRTKSTEYRRAAAASTYRPRHPIPSRQQHSVSFNQQQLTMGSGAGGAGGAGGAMQLPAVDHAAAAIDGTMPLWSRLRPDAIRHLVQSFRQWFK
jgi:hypothetical protein